MGEKNIGMQEAITQLGESAKEGGGLLDLFKAKGVGALKALGMAALNMVATAAIAFLAQQAIKFVDEIINHTKYLNESAKEFGAQMKQTESEIDSYGEKIAAQKAIIEDHTSSIEDVTEARAELYKIQSDMIAAYGGESESIKTVTDAINGQSDALERNIEALKEQQHQKAIEDFNKANDNWYKSTVRQMSHGTMTDDGQTIPQTITAYEEFMDNMENYKTDLSSLNNILPEKEFQDVINKYKNENSWDDLSSAVGNVNQFVELYDELMDTARMLRDSQDGGIDQARYDYIQKQLTRLSSPARETSQSNRDLYEQEMLHQIRQSKELNGKYSDLSALYDKYRKADTAELQQEVFEAYNAAVQQIADDKSLSYGIKQQFMSLYPDLKAEADKWVFELNFKANKDGLKDEIQKQIDEISKAVGHTVTKEELDHWDDSQHDAVANAAYGNYARTLTQNGISSVQVGNEIASQNGVLTTENLEALKSRIESITGVIQNNLDQTLITAVKDVDNLPSKFAAAYRKVSKNVGTETDRINTALKLVAREAANTAKTTEKELGGMDLSDVAKHLTKLNEVYDKLKKDGEVKWNTINTKDFKESFGDIKDETGEFQKAFDDFHKVLSSTPNDTKAVQDAFDTLASSYVYNSDCMSLLNENNKDLVIGMLSDNGVLNATEVVNDALARKSALAEYDAMSTQLLAEKDADLANMTDETATKTLEQAVQFLQSEEAANLDTAAIAKLILEQWALNGSQIDTSGSCSALQDLAAMAGVATGQIIALNNALAGGTGGVPAGMSADEWDQVYDKEAYFKHEQERRQQETLEQLRGARERVRLGGGGGGSSSGGSGSGGNGGNKEPSKTDKEWDWAARKAELLQRDNDKLRDAVNSEYVILQDREGNISDYESTMSRLNDAKEKLEAKGYDVDSEEFKHALDVIGLEDIADKAEESADRILTTSEALADGTLTLDEFDKIVSGNGTTSISEAVGPKDEDIELINEYAQCLEDLKTASTNTSKTLEENGRGKLSIIEDLIESDKQQIEFYKQQKESYKKEYEGYKEEILKAFGEDEGPQWIKDIEEGNLDPEKWEQLSTYDSNDQKAKDRYEAIDRALKTKQKEEEVDDTLHKKMQQLVDDEQERFKLQLNILKAKQEEIQSLIDEAQHNLDMKEILGEVVTEQDYRNLIDLNDDLIDSYREQIKVLRAQSDELDEGEDAWYDVQSQIRDCESAIRDAVKQQAEWNDIILRMPVENISRFLKLVQNLGQTLKNWLSVNDAKGIAQTAEQVQTSWTTAYDQVADSELGIMKQLEDFQDLIDNYDLGSTKFSEVDDEIQSARNSLTELVEEMIELNKTLLTLPIEQLSKMTTYLDGTLSDLQQIQSTYETSINAVIDTITKKIDEVQENYNELEKQIQKQIKPLQDQLDALQKANEKRDRELQIEQALYELEKAKEQKTVQVIRNGRVEYAQDESAIRNAQQGYDDALYNKLTGELQDKIDELNDQLAKAEEATNNEVDALNAILKRWQTIIPDTESNRNNEIASQYFRDKFGVENWQELVLKGKDENGNFADEEIYQGTRIGVEQNSVERRDTQRQIDVNNIITDSLTRLVDDFQADRITSEQLSAKVSKLMGFVSDGIITGQERLENTLSLGDYSNLGAALDDANTQRENQIQIFGENLKKATENKEKLDGITKRWDDFKAWYNTTYKTLFEQYKKIDFIGNYVKHISDSIDDDDDDGPGTVWEGSSRNPDDYGRGSVYDGSSTGWDSDFSGGGPGRYAEGLEVGAVGELTHAQRFRAIQALGLKKLDPDEFPAILHLGEGVINRQQQSTMLDNFRSALALGGAGGGSVIQMSFGDITLPSVTNGQDFAESLAAQFQPAMNQVFSKIFRR